MISTQAMQYLVYPLELVNQQIEASPAPWTCDFVIKVEFVQDPNHTHSALNGCLLAENAD